MSVEHKCGDKGRPNKEGRTRRHTCEWVEPMVTDTGISLTEPCWWQRSDKEEKVGSAGRTFKSVATISVEQEEEKRRNQDDSGYDRLK